MGVKGLTGLIRSDNRFLIKNYRLHNVKIVIDANNLSADLLERVEDRFRTDRVGVNLVAYGKQVELFFDNLRKCKVEPILVFDGAQTKDAVIASESRKIDVNKERLVEIGKLVSLSNSYHKHRHPACTNMILKSIAIEKQVKVVQCFYRADKNVAKIANDCDGFVLSADSNFFILDVKRGVIRMRYWLNNHVKKQNGNKRFGGEIKPYFYIECELFNQSHFLRAYSGLDKSCLPLFASIASNDASAGKLRFLFDLVSPKADAGYDYLYCYDRLRVLFRFLSNKSLEQCIDSLLALVEAERREEIEILIRKCIRYYDLPEEDNFDREISKHFEQAFYQKYSEKFDVISIKKEMRKLAGWLRMRIESSNLSKNCLELALRNICFLQPEMDDFRKPGAHHCINRYRSVMLTLMRSSHTDNQPCSFYGREGDSIERFELEPLLELENYGSIDYLIFDVCDDLSDDIVTTKLPQSDKTAILLATFHSSPAEFSDSVAQYEEFLKPQHAEEFAVVNLLLRYVELEENVTFSTRFQGSLLVTYLYYLHFGDSKVETNVLNSVDESYLDFLDNLKQLARVNYLEDIDQWSITDYDITIVPNITQMQTAIRAYEELNAFLGTTLPTLRMHKWFNSSFIYNFAAIFERESLQMPSIVGDQ